MDIEGLIERDDPGIALVHEWAGQSGANFSRFGARVSDGPSPVRQNERKSMTATQPDNAAVGRTSRWRIMTMLALVGTVLSVGARIPLPSVDHLAAAGYLEGSPGGAARVSVLALGILPLLSVLLFCETFKLVLPGVAAQGVASPRGRRAVRVAIMAATLVLAAMQAAGISQALVQSGLAVDDGLLALATVASLVAGVAVLIVVAERIRLPDLPQAGFWLVLSLPWCVGLGTAFVDLVGLTSLGVVGVPTIGLALGSVVAAVAAPLFCAAALRRRIGASGGDPCRWTSILIWPPFLAGSLAGLAAGIAVEFAPPGLAATPGAFSVLWSLAFVLALPLVVFLSARRIKRIFPGDADWSGKHAVLTIVAVVQVAVCDGLVLLGERLPVLLPPGSVLIALAVVFWSVGRALGVGVDPSGTVEAADLVEHALPARDDPMARSG